MQPERKLTRAEIEKHLGLVLNTIDDPETFREAVEKIHDLATKPARAPHPSRPSHRIQWVQIDYDTWTVRCDREDAKHIEELFADFRSRKEIKGNWRTVADANGPKVEKLTPTLFVFTFERVKPVRRRKASGKKVKKAAAKIKLTFGDIAEDEKAELLADLKKTLFG